MRMRFVPKRWIAHTPHVKTPTTTPAVHPLCMKMSLHMAALCFVRLGRMEGREEGVSVSQYYVSALLIYERIRRFCGSSSLSWRLNERGHTRVRVTFRKMLVAYAIEHNDTTARHHRQQQHQQQQHNTAAAATAAARCIVFMLWCTRPLVCCIRKIEGERDRERTCNIC